MKINQTSFCNIFNLCKPIAFFILLLLAFVNVISAQENQINKHSDLFIENLNITENGGLYRLSITVFNSSSAPVSSVILSYQLSEKSLQEKPLSILPPNSETAFIYELGLLSDRYYQLKVTLSYKEKIISNQHKYFLVGESPLVLNEILFKQSTANQEWVEIFNRSDSLVIMDNYFLIDAADNKTRFSGSIAPLQYKVICRDKERMLAFYPNIDSDNIIESTSWAILNNDRETILLTDEFGTQFDYFEYTAPASYPADLSLERVNPYDDNSVWKRSIHPNLSTPTLPNSHLPLPYDIAIRSAVSVTDEDRIVHHLVVENIGYLQIDEFDYECYLYLNEDTQGRLIHNERLIMQDNETLITFYSGLSSSDFVTYRYIIISDLDGDLRNNEALTFINNDALPVVVNEVMFRPYDGEPQWIELIVNHRYKYLKDLTFQTRRGDIGFNIPTSADFLILTGNSTDSLYLYQKYNLYDVPILTGLPGLYVTVEELTLIDPCNNIIERFSYDPYWTTERGVSIERINPLLPVTADNWAYSLAADGSTPGRHNSIYIPLMPAKSTFNISPNPFSPLRGERTFFNFEFPERLNRVTCRIFDLKGRIINTIINQEITPATGTIIWDGYRDNGTRLSTGIYIVTIEAVGYDTERVFRAKQTVAIGQ